MNVSVSYLIYNAKLETLWLTYNYNALTFKCVNSLTHRKNCQHNKERYCLICCYY